MLFACRLQLCDRTTLVCSTRSVRRSRSWGATKTPYEYTCDRSLYKTRRGKHSGLAMLCKSGPHRKNQHNLINCAQQLQYKHSSSGMRSVAVQDSEGEAPFLFAQGRDAAHVSSTQPTAIYIYMLLFATRTHASVRINMWVCTSMLCVY